jgi:hypothetical protein
MLKQGERAVFARATDDHTVADDDDGCAYALHQGDEFGYFLVGKAEYAAAQAEVRSAPIEP